MQTHMIALTHSVNQLLTNQSVTKSTNEQINCAINQKITQSFNQLLNRPIKQSIDQSVNQSGKVLNITLKVWETVNA